MSHDHVHPVFQPILAGVGPKAEARPYIYRNGWRTPLYVSEFNGRLTIEDGDNGDIVATMSAGDRHIAELFAIAAEMADALEYISNHPGLSHDEIAKRADHPFRNRRRPRRTSEGR